MKLDVEGIVRDFWKLPPLGTTQEDASRWLEQAITAYADEKLEEAAKQIPTTWLDPLLSGKDRLFVGDEIDCREVERFCKALVERIQSLKSTPAPGGAKVDS